jgi:hypothetical protein
LQLHSYDLINSFLAFVVLKYHQFDTFVILGSFIKQMSDNTLDWTMPPPTADGSIEHESHGDETACLLEGKKRKTRSPMWKHFTAVPGKVKQAQCNYCDTLIMYKDGTSGMRSLLKRCDDYDGNTEVTQPKKRKEINAQGQVVSSPSVYKFDQAAC